MFIPGALKEIRSRIGMKMGLSIRRIEEMREVTMSSEVPTKGSWTKEDDGPVVKETYSRQRTSLRAQRAAYYMIRRPGKNITVLPEYHLGKEYPKTYGHFHKPETEETYEILLGDAAVLIQKGIDPVEEIGLIKLKKGASFTVPKGYAHSLINLGEGPVVTLDDYDPAEFRNNYEPIKEKHGFAYYLIEKEGKLKAIPNPNYGKVPPLKIS